MCGRTVERWSAPLFNIGRSRRRFPAVRAGLPAVPGGRGGGVWWDSGRLCPASPGHLLGWGAPGVCTEKGRLSLPACPTPVCWADPPHLCPCARLQLIPDREAAQCLLTRLSNSLHPARSRRQSTGVPGAGLCEMSPASLASAGCE